MFANLLQAPEALLQNKGAEGEEKGLKGGARNRTGFLPRWAGSFVNLKRPELFNTTGTSDRASLFMSQRSLLVCSFHRIKLTWSSSVNTSRVLPCFNHLGFGSVCLRDTQMEKKYMGNSGRFTEGAAADGGFHLRQFPFFPFCKKTLFPQMQTNICFPVAFSPCGQATKCTGQTVS